MPGVRSVDRLQDICLTKFSSYLADLSIDPNLSVEQAHKDAEEASVYLQSSVPPVFFEKLVHATLAIVNKYFYQPKHKPRRPCMVAVVTWLLGDHMRHLSLDTCRMLCDRLSVPHVFACLARTPRLETLAIGRLNFWKIPELATLSDRLAGLPHLTSLRLEYICLPEMLTKLADKCPRLKELSVKDSTKIGDSEVAEIVRCRRLESLDISGTSVTGSGSWEILSALTKLKSFEHCPFNCNSGPFLFDSREEMLSYIWDFLSPDGRAYSAALPSVTREMARPPAAGSPASEAERQAEVQEASGSPAGEAERQAEVREASGSPAGEAERQAEVQEASGSPAGEAERQAEVQEASGSPASGAERQAEVQEASGSPAGEAERQAEVQEASGSPASGAERQAEVQEASGSPAGEAERQLEVQEASDSPAGEAERQAEVQEASGSPAGEAERQAEVQEASQEERENESPEQAVSADVQDVPAAAGTNEAQNTIHPIGEASSPAAENQSSSEQATPAVGEGAEASSVGEGDLIGHSDQEAGSVPLPNEARQRSEGGDSDQPDSSSVSGSGDEKTERGGDPLEACTAGGNGRAPGTAQNGENEDKEETGANGGTGEADQLGNGAADAEPAAAPAEDVLPPFSRESSVGADRSSTSSSSRRMSPLPLSRSGSGVLPVRGLGIENFWLFNPKTEEVALARLCPAVRRLRLDFVFQDIGMSPNLAGLSLFQHVTRLDISSYDAPRFSVMWEILRRIGPGLTSLAVHVCDDYTSTAVIDTTIARFCPKLEEYSFTGDYSVRLPADRGDDDLDFTIQERHTKLKSLRLGGFVTGRRLLFILAHASSIRSLYLDGELRHLDDAGFFELFAANPLLSLEEMWVNVSSGLSIRAVLTLVLDLRSSLRRLGRLSSLEGMSRAEFLELRKQVAAMNMDIDLVWVTPGV